MAKRTTPPKEQQNFWSRVRVYVGPDRQREIVALLLALFGAITLLSLFGIGGALSSPWAQWLRAFVGWGAYVLALAVLVAAFGLLRREENVFDEFPIPWARIVAFEILFAAVLGLLHLYFASDDRAALQLAERGDAGGYLGWAIASVASLYLGNIFAALALGLIALLTLRFVFDLTPVANVVNRALNALKPAPVNAPVAKARVRPSPPAPLPTVGEGRIPLRQLPLPQPTTETDAAGNGHAPPKVIDEKKAPPPVPPRASILNFGRKPAHAKAAPPKPTWDPLLAIPRAKMLERLGNLPALDLLNTTADAEYAQTTAKDKAHTIEQTLDHFGIPAKVIDINAGPTITQFAVEPGFVERRGLDGQVRNRKVPVSRILSLSNDLALALAAAPIRIEAPVPGRSYVGIEVPNEQIALVSLRGVMESDTYKKLQPKAKLEFALGRDVSGAPAVADLAAMPHLLVAGATGSGKSVCINSIIACMLIAHSPDELRLIMVDPKRVELVNYNGIPHLIGPVITDVQQVVPALKWAVQLMDARFKEFSKEQTRNIEAYNAKMDKTRGNRLPYVMIIIDELADLMLAAPDETEKLITRLAQMARATGVHLVLATQRPSVDVVTGLIKANFPARISFAVTSSVDSRVVLDSPGAEKLLGKGDMLFMAPDSSKLARLQGCFVSDEELARLVKHWRDLQEEFDYIERAPWDEMSASSDGDGKSSPNDELVDKATELILKTNTATISFLQRKLGIGYPRAARLMDQLEELGVVGPDEGNGKPRAILITEEKGKKKK
jgi:S-DNA-T family DNA segregation ATPase FtsK/SpoIIIE